MDHNNKLIELAVQIARMFKDKMTYNAHASHLTMLQIQALMFLKNKENLQMSEIAQQFGVRMSTATSLLNRLVAAHLVIRKKDPKDRRIVRIKLTKKGCSLIGKAIRERKKKIYTLLSYLPANDKKVLLRILQTIATKMKETYEN